MQGKDCQERTVTWKILSAKEDKIRTEKLKAGDEVLCLFTNSETNRRFYGISPGKLRSRAGNALFVDISWALA